MGRFIGVAILLFPHWFIEKQSAKVVEMLLNGEVGFAT
jgi:hypothetical protein